MKIVAKASYALMLLLSLLSSTLVVMALNTPGWRDLSLQKGEWAAGSGICVSDDELGLSCCISNGTAATAGSYECVSWPEDDWPEDATEDQWWHVEMLQLSRWISGLSLAGAFMAATTTFIDPAQRWMQLRGAALNLEAEIWKFRTRTAAYAMTSGKELQSKVAEEHLRQYSEHLKQHVGKAASVRYDII
jgi:hypothetical protein